MMAEDRNRKASDKANKIVHLTSVHDRTDARIFLKECRSLAQAGYEVFLIVADGKGDETVNGVRIVDSGPRRRRLARMLLTTGQAVRKALSVDADIYHLHDPELLPWALRLKRRGKAVIFDAHEDLPEQTRSKPYIPLFARGLVASVSGMVQNWVCARLDLVVAATPVIAGKFRAANIRSTDICNFPVLGKMAIASSEKPKQCEVCYVGGISAVRGIRQIVAAIGRVKSGARLNLAGQFPRRACGRNLSQRLTGSVSTNLAFWIVRVLATSCKDRLRVLSLCCRHKPIVTLFL